MTNSRVVPEASGLPPGYNERSLPTIDDEDGVIDHIEDHDFIASTNPRRILPIVSASHHKIKVADVGKIDKPRKMSLFDPRASVTMAAYNSYMIGGVPKDAFFIQEDSNDAVTISDLKLKLPFLNFESKRMEFLYHELVEAQSRFNVRKISWMQALGQ
ncbi:hypothetical protein HDU76_000579 [Blyttiomyces sp. JEL0837]|nr:hypothetical protein HDU76_000579 [Blyttiomyces sp. JEL0837]